ncbi:MAG: hypothetical protein P0Y65_05350 [Candidatus Devosia phytovorans]|uniref:Polysaccharide biosynthesis protein n=1 Tax=Candidatus Devosia phytovorans TaxID=3121372 RepID=A0AAJ5VVJ0_9HYPH|nr:hypothetical protein [Devosia sp.]WEK05681.1 MAG: hypothetical protein P0Y65_05350 [Devosia sp.]
MLDGVRRVLGSSAAPSVAVTAGSVFGIALNLVIPFVLPMAEYALYSLLLGLAQLVTSLSFEWMRLAMLRHGYGADEVVAHQRRLVLARCYVATTGVLLVAAVLVASITMVWSWAGAISIVLACAAIQGAFDGQMAAARARFDNLAFSGRWIVRALLGLVLAIVFAAVFQTGMAALAGLTLSYPLAALLWRENLLAALGRGEAFDWAEFRLLFGFGELAALATNLSVAVPAVVRSLVVGSLGLAGAGGVLLAIDIGQRLFSTVGTAINVVVVQRAIRAMEHDDSAAVRRRLRDQVVVAVGVVAPLAIGLIALRGQVAELIVPLDYRVGFAAGLLAVTLASALQAMRQYALDPLFLIFGRSGGAPLAPAVVLALLAVSTITPMAWWGSALAAAVLPLLLAHAIGLVVTIAALCLLTPMRWPWHDLWRLALAVGAMGTIAAVLPASEGLADGVVVFLALAVPYAGCVLALDVGGIRSAGVAQTRGGAAT